MTAVIACVKVTAYCEVMTQPTEPGQDPVARTIARRLPVLRERHGWSAQQLAEKCAAAGSPELNRAIIANIESGRRRSVSIDEVLVLAKVLDVTPPYLMEPDPDSEGLRVGDATIGHELAHKWLTGHSLLPGQDPLIELAQAPPDDLSLVLKMVRGVREYGREEFRALLEAQKMEED